MTRKFIPLRYRVVVHPDGDEYWVGSPDFPELAGRARYADLAPEVMAADCLAHVIIERLHHRQDLPFPGVREQDGEMFVVPRHAAVFDVESD